MGKFIVLQEASRGKRGTSEMKLAEFVVGLVGGMATYYVATFLLDQWITGTTVSDNILKMVVPIAIAAGTVLAVLVHMFITPGDKK
jgi:hypothetical protein